MKGVKLTGQEYNDFCNSDVWGKDWYWDETLFLHNGKEVDDLGELDPTDEVILLEGTVFKGSTHDAVAVDALAFVRKWLKARTVTTLMVEVPKDQIEAFKADMRAKRLKVLS
jgi:hypothetical protein